MYLPSMLFGGSSLIHLLASNPRVVALFGLGTLVATLLQSPFGTPDVIGTAGYIKQLEHVVRLQGPIDPDVIARAHSSARALAQSPGSRLAEIVEETLGECGPACFAIETAAVLDNREMLADVLFLHALNDAHTRRASMRVKVVTKETDRSQ